MSGNTFDLCGPLPAGTTVLEASAGTGKTYAIVGLAVRYVAEAGVDPARMLLVTFSRNATKELRERTRARFAAVAAGLADPAPGDDPLVAHLAAADEQTVALRRRRLLQALSDFDATTIATTHSFCQRMLDGLGLAGERDPGAVVVEEATEIIEETIADRYLAVFGTREQRSLGPGEARKAARGAVFDPQAALVPDDAAGTAAGDAVAFAGEVRAEVSRRKQVLGIRDYNDLPTLLHGVLTDPAHGPAACRRVQERFEVVLVDEFQDTDPLQWGILRSAFHGHSTLILVGDPKQAIYAFRGAEVLAYLDAVGSADAHLELGVNWRTDAPLVAALHHLYGGAALGHRKIVVHPVGADQRKSRAPGTAPLRLRYLPRTGAGPLNKQGFPVVGPVRRRVAEDVAADIVALLERGAPLHLAGEDRSVAPGDIAVLVRKNAQVTQVHAALERAGVPAVMVGGQSVFLTAAAKHWLWLLQALEQPHRADRVRLAALTPLLGRTAESIDSGGDDAVAEIGSVLREWAMVFAQSGFAALFERLATWSGLEERLLARAGGERGLTDLRHIAQLLNGAAVADSLGLAALTRWLTEQIRDPNVGGSDRSRRLDSDAAAVQIATVHASKGLEYPFVYVPFGWDAAKPFVPDRLLLHDHDGRRILDVGGEYGPGYRDRRAEHDAEEAGEELRLLYVALTRAKCRVVAWWAPSSFTDRSALHRILLGRKPGELDVPPRARVADDETVARQLSEWAAGSPLIALEAVGDGAIAVPTWTPPHSPGGELAAAEFTRAIDFEWRRTSYSALTAAAHDMAGHDMSDHAAAESDEQVIDDEPQEPPLSESAGEGLPSPMNGLPAGAAFGTVVHAVLEVVDTAAADLAAEVGDRCREVVEAGFSDVDPEALAVALVPVLHTPLAGGATLARIAPSDRLPELDFELPLAGGDDCDSAVRVTLGQVARLLRAHLPAGDTLAGYADQLDALGPTVLRGYLTGSIDAVLRLPAGDGAGHRYVVVDYKTNRLSIGDLTTADFTRAAMAAEMIRAHYPLQALLYSVALHRYLRWRLPGYDPAVHLGGVQYLFVRGMAGPDTPDGAGVFDWTPPAQLVCALSDLLAGSEVAA
ncbi:UvrD-helicase domain-containing protein [Speluncibacter jeojiensis]|uniref:UvrD-helicase domain-containing protein n=1 Tax=Speluncibacter jeojiensis TaxID=2710754 RepID=UPI0024100F1E|nr:UvrD-helicase domain-containing protein [Rhodococcus sp. D2-41]